MAQARKRVAVLVGLGLLVPAVARADETATTTLHITAAENTYVERRMSEEGYQVVCQSPCDRALPSDGTYRINGPKIAASRQFKLSPDAKEVRLTVDEAAAWKLPASLVMVAVGTVLLFGAVPFVLNDPGDTPALGWIALGGGLGLATGGVILFLGSNTTVKEDTAVKREETPLPAARITPLFSGRF